MTSQKEPTMEKQLQDIAYKYHVGDKLNEPFYRNMCTTYFLCKQKTGRDPQEWLQKFDVGTYKGTGAIGWIDALNAIQAVFTVMNDQIASAKEEEANRWIHQTANQHDEQIRYIRARNELRAEQRKVIEEI
jgi:hypothetical protein